ncbi:MAG: methyl-accepting chemotaxis protein [Spirochaetes bacterium]|nr:methyl-accepting chemotaxis protein [Spirochaetota bacterium]
MKYKRRKYVVEGNFQARFILRFVLIIVGVTLLSTGSILLLFYLKYHHGGVDPASIIIRVTPEGVSDASSLFSVVFTPLIAANLLVLIISVPLSLLYSHKIAGPIYRLQQSFDLLLSGEMDFMISLRRRDEFRYLADKMNALIDYMRRNIREVKSSHRVIQEQVGRISRLMQEDIVDTEALKDSLKELERFFKERKEPFSY